MALSCKLPTAIAGHRRNGASTPRLVCLYSPLSLPPRRSWSGSKRRVQKGVLIAERTGFSKQWEWGNGSRICTATFAQLAVATESPRLDELSEAKGASVLLDVSGMMCGGCAASVRRTLASDPKVAHAAVNLLTGTAAVQLCPGLSEEAGATLAATLTKSGFPTGLRNPEAPSRHSDTLAQQRQDSLRDTTVQLVVAWSLVAVCLSHHAGHLLHGLGFHQFAHGACFFSCGKLLSPSLRRTPV